MRRFVQRFPRLLARNSLHSPSNLLHSNINPRVVPLFDPAIPRFVFFSSESDSARGVKSNEVVSKEELKKRIKRFLDDRNEDALPELFEAMMIWKLAGNHNDSDNELMEEVRKYPVNDANMVDDIESDGDGDSSDSDTESDDLRDSDSSDSDSESDGLRDSDSSDSDIGSDELGDADSSDSDDSD